VLCSLGGGEEEEAAAWALTGVLRPSTAWSTLRLQANFTALEEIPFGEEVLAGTFFLYEHPIIILFDSGASHDFLCL
jgi:hypothetical protein